ncbi:MAG: 2-hydroxycarboxylate transporter family protein [Lachnospiraceae bacterium]|nr:2-hydroxycarboxylate transporter family protein [Lachnospiraceae bacterium]
MEKKLKFSVYGLGFVEFAAIAAVVLVATYTGRLNNDFVGTIPFLMVVGGFLFWLGDVVPFVNKYLGGACLLPLLGGSALKYFGLIPEGTGEAIGAFMKGGFQNMYLCGLLVGSVMCMDRKTVLNATARYLPAILGSQVCAILALIFGGIITGIPVKEAIFYIGAPCMSGGSGGAMTTLPTVYSELSGTDMMGMAGPFMCYASIANVLAILFAAVLSSDAFKRFSGEGEILMRKDGTQIPEEKKRPATSDNYHCLAAGMMFALSVMVAGNILSGIIPQMAYLVWAVILAIVLKCCNLVPKYLEEGATYFMNFMLRGCLPMLICGIGINSLNLGTLGEYFTVSAFIIIVLGILGSLIGAMVFGRLVGLFPMETGVTAGLCCCNIGGSGDIAVLSAAKRMNLLAFASISTRIGGALMVIWISMLYPVFFH